MLKGRLCKAVPLVGLTAAAWLCIHAQSVETSNGRSSSPRVIAVHSGATKGRSSQKNSSANVVVESVKRAYLREFGQVVDHPAIYNDPSSRDCRGRGHLMTTAYVRETE